MSSWPSACIVAAGMLCFGARPAASAPCSMATVSVDTSEAELFMGVRCGEGPGQTFVAEDTLIHSVTVWRASGQTPYGGHLKLWIAGVDSSGAPDFENILLDGPVITVPFGDGVHPIKMEFVLDPPFRLPGPGRYYFAAQDYCGGHWGLLASASDPYPGGHAWRSGISCFDGCYLSPYPYSFDSYDLVFTIAFCRDVATGAGRRSWGQLKLLYR